MLSYAGEAISLSAEEAIPLFEAKPQEEPFKTSEQFDDLYQNLKKRLFLTEDKATSPQPILKAIKKLKVIKDANCLSNDYIDDVIKALKSDALSGFEIQFINQLKKKDYDKLPETITPQYIHRQLQTEASISEGEETIILSEEITSAK
jgi:hypothetical protein